MAVGNKEPRSFAWTLRLSRERASAGVIQRPGIGTEAFLSDSVRFRNRGRAVALSEDQEKRHIIDQFLQDSPGVSRGSVEDALEQAAEEIAPSENREKLKEAMKRIVGSR